jgi:Response regulator of the LytR/AlgR family
MHTADIGYFSPRAKAIVSLIVALTIVLHHQHVPWSVIFRNIGFYVSVAFSWLIAWLIIQFIDWYSRRLNGIPAYNRTYETRFWAQLVGGVAVPCLLAVAMAFGFLESFGRSFARSGYMAHEFPIICQLIVIMNLVYLTIHYRQQAMSLAAELDQLKIRMAEIEETLEDEKRRTESHRQQWFTAASAVKELRDKVQLTGYIEMFDVYTKHDVSLGKIVYIAYENRKVTAYTHKGKYSRKQSLNQIAAELPAYWFFKANSKEIINRKHIKEGIGEKAEKRGMVITMKWKSTDKRVVISRDRKKAYLEWYAMVNELPGRM